MDSSCVISTTANIDEQKVSEIQKKCLFIKFLFVF